MDDQYPASVPSDFGNSLKTYPPSLVHRVFQITTGLFYLSVGLVTLVLIFLKDITKSDARDFFGVLLFSGFGLWLLFDLYRRWQNLAVIYEKGFAFRDREGWRAWRWEQVVDISLRGSSRARRCRVQFDTGEEIDFSNELKDWRDLKHQITKIHEPPPQLQPEPPRTFWANPASLEPSKDSDNFWTGGVAYEHKNPPSLKEPSAFWANWTGADVTKDTKDKDKKQDHSGHDGENTG